MPFTETASDVLIELPARVEAAARARRALHEARVPEDLAHTVDLIATELIANALRHGVRSDDDRILFAAAFVDDFVRVEVADPGEGFDPAQRHSASGYGLRMVDKLASRWGVESGRGTRVWAEVDRRSRRFPRRDGRAA